MNSKLRILLKVKAWKEIIRKLNIPEERKKLSDKEAGDLALYMQKLEEEVLHLQQKFKYKHSQYINFYELKKDFFKKVLNKEL